VTWSLALAAPNAEGSISVALSQRCIPHHIFRIKKKAVRRGRVVELLVPAFPRYVFVPYEQCGTIASDPEHGGVTGITGLVRFGAYEQGPEQVTDAIVTELVSRCPDGNDVLPTPTDSNDPTAIDLKFGDRVRVMGDQNLVFGSIGVYRERVSPGKASILLPWFNGMVQTVVDEADLEKIPQKIERKRYRRGRRGRARREVMATPSAVRMS